MSQQYPPGYEYPAMAQKPGNGLAVASLVLGILSIVLICVWYISIPASILAIIFGVIGRGRAKAGASGGGMATGGLICGVIAVCLVVLLVAFGVAILSMLGIEGMEQLRQAAEQAASQQATQP